MISALAKYKNNHYLCGGKTNHVQMDYTFNDPVIRETDENIRGWINESRSIAAEVTQARVEICSDIRLQCQKSAEGRYNNEGYIHIENEKAVQIKSMKLHVFWECFDFCNRYVYDQNSDSLFRNAFNTVGENGVAAVYFRFFSVRGKIVDEAMMADTVQHEISHAWETFNYGQNYKHMARYNDAVDNLFSSENKYLQYIGNIFYMHKKFEVRAHSNGAYAYLISCPHKELVRSNIHQTQLYAAITTLRSELAELKKLSPTDREKGEVKTALDYIKKHYQMSYDDIIRLGERTVKYLDYTMARVIQQVEDDLLKENMRKIAYPVTARQGRFGRWFGKKNS